MKPHEPRQPMAADLNVLKRGQQTLGIVQVVRRRDLWIAFLCVALALAVSGAWFLNMPPTTNCGAEVSAESKIRTIRPTKVVAQPWKGRHRVYGIFMVPQSHKDKRKYSSTLTVRGFNGEFTPGLGPETEYAEDVVAESGHYLTRVYVPTRVALWFLFTGQFGDLRLPCNWALEFVERAL